MIDARGYACPMPVVMVQKAVEGGGAPAAGSPAGQPLLGGECHPVCQQQRLCVESAAPDDEYTLVLTRKP